MISPGLGLGLRPGFPLIFGVSSGFGPASLPSLLHLRTLLLEQLATSSAGDGSAPGQKQSSHLTYVLPHAFIKTVGNLSFLNVSIRKRHLHKCKLLSVTCKVYRS